VNNREIARVLERIGALLEFKGDNPFKVRAYSNAARTVSGLPYALEHSDALDTLDRIPGIGEALLKKLRELIQTGRLEYLERLESEISPEVLEMLRIPGLGPRKLRRLVDALGVGSIGELEYACRENRIRLLKGFGEKSQENLLKGIEMIQRFRGYLLLSTAREQAREIVEGIRASSSGVEATVSGAIRRCSETVSAIDLVIRTAPGEREHVIGRVRAILNSADGQPADRFRVSGLLDDGASCTIHLPEPQFYPFALLLSTGSTEHVEALSGHAREHGFSLTDRGLIRNGDFLPVRSESDIYGHLGIPFIPPELREGCGELEAALEGNLPLLLEPSDIRGLLHVHTRWSDGSHTIGEMALAAKEMGMEYIGIADHSVSAAYAGGLSADAVRRQWEEIESLNDGNPGIRILKGIECDIRSDGSLDYDDSILEGFDFIIASVHSKLRMDRSEATNRLVRAASHPLVTMIGHPTGRLLLAREGYPLDMDALLDACARHGAMIELNADPHRLDLDWRHLRDAAARGVMVGINPDAHAVPGLATVWYGVCIARKGWLRREDVLNTLPIEEVMKKIGKAG
jgi:DNA polymerase (family 10)